MPIDSAAVSPNAGPGRPSTARLMAYLLLSGLLMLLDQRGQFIPRLRALAENLVSPVYQVAEAPVAAVRGISTYGRSFDRLLERNEAQREQLLMQAGEMQRLAALEEENRRLRDLLQATEGRDLSFRFAELVQVSLDPYSHQVLVDRGADDGVFVGQAVIDGLGVMGQVESVTGGQARVRLISDPDHAIPVQVLRTGQRTVAMGTGEAGRLLLPNLPMQSDVREGDVLVTSGLGERFPAGFPVGEVAQVRRETGEAFMEVDARPLAALDRGREVLLVLPAPAAFGPVADSAAPEDPTGDMASPDEGTPEVAPREDTPGENAPPEGATPDGEAGPDTAPSDEESTP